MAERAERSPIVRAAHRRPAEAVSAFTGSSRSFQGQNPCHPDAEKDGGKNASNSSENIWFSFGGRKLGEPLESSWETMRQV